MAPSGATIMLARCIVVLTATKRQRPQQMWPQGVSVALLGGEKQIGQEYPPRSSSFGFLLCFGSTSINLFFPF